MEIFNGYQCTGATKNKVSLLSIVVLFILFLLPNLLWAQIKYPWRAAPLFAKTGEDFEILFDNVTQSSIDSVVLEGPYSSSKLRIESVKIGKFEYDTFTKNYTSCKILVQVPIGLPEDLYDLYVYNDGEVHRSRKSVKVLQDLNTQHTFIHISDTHISRNWVGTQDDGYAKELELLDKFIDVANIIAPDFIIVTGDIIMHYTRLNPDENGWGNDKIYDGLLRPTIEEKYRNYFEGAKGFKGVHGFNAPVFNLPGNHDFYGFSKHEHLAIASQWNDLCGKRVYGVSFAGTRILAADDFLGDPVVDIPADAPMSGYQGKFFEEYLKENGPGSLQILAQHRNDRVDTLFIDKHKIDILLHGHDHSPHYEYIGSTPTLHIRSGTPCRSGEIENWREKLGFFRIFYVDGKNFEFTEPLRFTDNPIAGYKDIQTNLSLTFENPNDGCQSTNRAILQNRFSIKFPNCRIRFVMEKGRYEVEGGRIHQIIESKELTVVDVSVDVGAKSHSIVDIKLVK